MSLHSSLIQQPVKILVVDDREDNLLSIETILEKEDYQIVKAASGRAALKILLGQHDFTLILMDVQMPEMSGIETAELIYQRDKLKHIPIIFITAHSSDERYMFEGYKMGAVDFIYKPINPELLRYKVSVFVDLYRKTHQLLQQERSLKVANARLEKEVEERRITEQKIWLLNGQLVQNNNELKQTNEELDRFAYVASHDLQEPLRKIMIFSDVLKHRLAQLPDADVHNALAKMTRACQRMQLLIKDLLHFSKQTGEIGHDFQTVNLNVVMKDVLAECDAQITASGAKVSCHSLPVVKGVHSLMHQLFQNLLCNAVKFVRPGVQPHIKIESSVISVSDLETPPINPRFSHYHKITVTDNGIGFDPRYASEIFVVFKRLHSYHEIEGSGIGLSICKKIVERHSGFISANSTLGEGSVFTVVLPVYEAVHTAVPTAASTVVTA